MPDFAGSIHLIASRGSAPARPASRQIRRRRRGHAGACRPQHPVAAGSSFSSQHGFDSFTEVLLAQACARLNPSSRASASAWPPMARSAPRRDHCPLGLRLGGRRGGSSPASSSRSASTRSTSRCQVGALVAHGLCGIWGHALVRHLTASCRRSPTTRRSAPARSHQILNVSRVALQPQLRSSRSSPRPAGSRVSWRKRPVSEQAAPTAACTAPEQLHSGPRGAWPARCGPRRFARPAPRDLAIRSMKKVEAYVRHKAFEPIQGSSKPGSRR